MAESTIVRNKRDGVVTVSASGGTPSYTYAYEAGDFSFSVPRESTDLYLDRGVIGSTPSIRKADDQPMTLSWTVYMRDIGDTANSYATPLDIAIRYASGAVASGWTSTLGNNSDEFTVTVAFTVDGSTFGESDKTLTFSYVVIRADGAEGQPNTVTNNGTSYQLIPVLS